MRFPGMLVSLFVEFVGSQMIRFVVSGSSIMGVFRKVMNLSRSIVRALWHGYPPGMLDIKRSPMVRSR
jgi:hypothetical protein